MQHSGLFNLRTPRDLLAKAERDFNRLGENPADADAASTSSLLFAICQIGCIPVLVTNSSAKHSSTIMSSCALHVILQTVQNTLRSRNNSMRK